MMAEIQRRLTAGLETMEPEALMKTWLPGVLQGGFQGMDQLQKMFWSQMSKGSSLGSGARKKT